MADNDVEVKIGVKDTGVAKEMKKINSSIKGMGKEVTAAVKQSNSSFNIMKGFIGGSLVTGGFNVLKNAAVGAFGAIVDKAKEMEQLETRFKTLTGSTHGAKVMLENLQNFAASTPFQLPGLSESAAKLISFGIAQDQIIPKLQVLGDVAAATGSDIGDISLIFGQVSAAGKLTGERLLQLQERAVPIGPALAKTMGVAEEAVRGLVSQGKVDFATFEKAFESLNAKGGFAFEGMVAQSKTLGGVMSTLSDNFGLVLNDVGQAFLPLMKEAALLVLNFVQENKELIKSFAAIAANTVTEEFARMKLIGEGLVRMYRELFDGTSAFGNMLVWVKDQVLAAFNIFTQLGRILGDVVIYFGDFDSQIAAVSQRLVNMYIPAMTNMLKATSAIVGVFDKDLAASIDAQIEKNTKLAQSWADTKAEGTAFAEDMKAVGPGGSEGEDPAQAAAQAAEIEAQKEEAKTQAILMKKQERKALLAEFDAMRKEEELTADQEFKLGEIEREANQDQQLLQLKEMKEQRRQEILKKGISDRKKALETEAKEKKKREDKFEKESFGSMFRVVKWQEMTDKQRLSNVESTSQNLAKLKDSENKQMAKLGKAAAIFNIGIDTARGAISAYTSLAGIPIVGPALGAIAAAAITAFGFEQMSKVKSANYATGGFVGGQNFTGDRVDVRANSGEAILNVDQQRQFLELADGRAGGNAGSNVTINVEGGLFANNTEQVDEMIDAIRDRIDFGNARDLGAA